jgi:hypothetical protein
LFLATTDGLSLANDVRAGELTPVHRTALVALLLNVRAAARLAPRAQGSILILSHWPTVLQCENWLPLGTPAGHDRLLTAITLSHSALQ